MPARKLTKLPSIAVAMTIYYKNPYEGYNGLVQESFAFGKKKPTGLAQLIVSVARTIADFWWMCMQGETRDGLRGEVRVAGETLVSLVKDSEEQV